MAHPPHVCQGINGRGRRVGDKQSCASCFREAAVDGKRRRTFQDSLVDAEEPEWGTIEHEGVPGLEQHGDCAGEGGKQQEEHQKDRDGKALKDERGAAKKTLAENG